MLASRVSTVVFDDGAATTVERWGESGPVMLCVHGMTSSRKSWLRLADRFADRYQVVAYDQRGHGDCAAVMGPMAIDRGVQDLMNVLDAIGGAQFLVGHSWGGAVAIRGGLLAPVKAVAAIDPMIVQVDAEWYDEYLEELEQSFKLIGSERDAATREEYSDWHPLDVEGKVHAVHCMTPEPIARLRSENVDARWDLREEIATYDKPLLLVMAGREGTIVPGDVVDEVAQNHSPKVRIEIFQDQGHNLFRTDFDRFADVLDRFLEDNR